MDYDSREALLEAEEAEFLHMVDRKQGKLTNEELDERFFALKFQPELTLARCQKYFIAKDSFTEIVLLTVIAYFCVSTEHRFINMCQEREEAKKEKEK